MAAVTNLYRKQYVYEQYMAIASKICSEEAIFNITKLGSIMIDILLYQQITLTGNTNDDSVFYKFREGNRTLITHVNLEYYPNLSAILDEHFDYIIKSNNTHNDSSIPKLSKKAVSYNKTINRYILTDQHEYQPIQIYTMLPNNTKVETSKLTICNEYMHNISKWVKVLCIYHTTTQNSRNTLLTYIKDNIWNDKMTEEDCYKIHWLLATACPFIRGSAGFAKVMLNAALLRCKLHPVKETMYYSRQTDWVAMLSPTFDEYYSKKNDMFETDDDFNNKLQDNKYIKNIAFEIQMIKEIIKQYSGGYRKKTRITRKKHRKYIK